MKADTILGGAATLVSQGFPDTADNLLQHNRDLTDDCAPLAALCARLSVYNAQASGYPQPSVHRQSATTALHMSSPPCSCLQDLVDLQWEKSHDDCSLL